MAELKMAEFNMAAIIKLSQNEWVKIFFVHNGWIQDGRIQDGCHHQVESEWMSLSQIELVESEFWAKWLNPRWQKSRWLPSSRVNQNWMSLSQSDIRLRSECLCSMIWEKIISVRIQDGRVDGCHHQVESEWISLSQSQKSESESVFEWIWEKITRCLNPRWQCLNPTWQNSRWLPSSSWVRMNEWSFFVQNGWIHDGRVQDGCHHQVESEWMSLSQIELDWVRVLCKMAESKMAEFKMAAIIKFSQNEWVWVRLN